MVGGVIGVLGLTRLVFLTVQAEPVQNHVLLELRQEQELAQILLLQMAVLLVQEVLQKHETVILNAVL